MTENIQNEGTEYKNDGYTTISGQVSGITIRRTAKHTEISIMENDWDNICTKIRDIKIKKCFDLNYVFLGAIFNSFVNICVELWKNIHTDYLNLLIWLCIFSLYTFATRVFEIPFIGKRNDEENKIHLNDLTTWIDRINSKIITDNIDTKKEKSNETRSYQSK